MQIDTGVAVAVAVAILGIGAALYRMDNQLTAMKDTLAELRALIAPINAIRESSSNLNTNIMLLIQQITLEAKRSRDDVIDEIQRSHRQP